MNHYRHFWFNLIEFTWLLICCYYWCHRNLERKSQRKSHSEKLTRGKAVTAGVLRCATCYSVTVIRLRYQSWSDRRYIAFLDMTNSVVLSIRNPVLIWLDIYHIIYIFFHLYSTHLILMILCMVFRSCHMMTVSWTNVFSVL